MVRVRISSQLWLLLIVALISLIPAAGLDRSMGPGRPLEAASVAEAGTAAGSDIDLLARVIAAEAQGEPYDGQVAVGAVIMNRIRHREFPNTLAGVIYQPHAFESVSNGLVWRRSPSSLHYRAAEQAVQGWDPVYGAIFFWNPAKPVVPWIWSRPIVVQIGRHVFAH